MSLLNTLVPLPQADVIAILDDEGNQILTDGHAMSVDLVENSTLFSHPVETNFVITDGKVVDPVIATFTILFEGDLYKKGYDDIKSLFLSSARLALQTRTGTYENMILESIPHEETPEVFDSIIMRLSLKEALTFSTVIVDAPVSTQDRGQIQPGAPEPTDAESGSLAFRSIFG